MDDLRHGRSGMDSGSAPLSRRLAVRHHRLMRLRLRRGIDSDAEAIAELYLRARKRAFPAIPLVAHTDEETRRWIARRIVPHTELWVAETGDGSLVGMLVLDNDWVDQLYVEPALTGQGIGGDLISLAKRQRASGLRLWTFESSTDAHRFYENHGFDARIGQPATTRKARPTCSTPGMADGGDW